MASIPVAGGLRSGRSKLATVDLPTSAMRASRFLMPSGGDDSAAMVDALTNYAPYAAPHVVLGPGVFKWNASVPAFARSIPVKVVGSGIDKTTIQFSSGAPRAFDFNKIADYDTFTGIEISDMTMDCNNVGGRHHVVIGNYVNGVQSTKINIIGLSVKRVKTINVPTDPTTVNHRLNIFLVVMVNVADNPCVMTDVVFEDLDFMHGGNMGISIGGGTTDGTGNGNMTLDRIYCARVNHDTGLPNTGAAYASTAMQIGSRDTGGAVTIKDCNGFNAGDVGIAVLNGRYTHVENCVVTDARTSEFQAGNFNPNMPADQTHTFRSCHAKVVNLNPSSAGPFAMGFQAGGAPLQQLGHVILDNCSFSTQATNTPQPGSAINVQVPTRSFTIMGDFYMNAPVINHSLTANYAGGLVLFNPGGNSTFNVRGALRSNVAGAITLNGFTFSFVDVSVPGLSASNYTLDVDAHYINYGLSGVAAHTFYGLNMDPGSVLATLPKLGGKYRMVVESHTSADTGPKGINLNNVYGASRRWVINGALRFPDCDFTQYPAGSIGQEVVIDGAVTYADVALSTVTTVVVFYPGILPATGVMPQPASFNIGALTGAITNLAGIRRKVFFTGNMPTAVTFQRRTDTAGIALGAATQAVYELEPGDRLNLTFSGTTGNNYDRIPAVL